MRLAEFIHEEMDAILADWDAFALTNEPAAIGMNAVALRNHAAHMLRAIIADLRTEQSREQGLAKSQSRAPPVRGDTAAHVHGEARLMSGFTIDQLLAEYRALRASVLRLWLEQERTLLATDTRDLLRFNEAIDQALTESVARYSAMIEDSHNLFLAILGHDLRNPLNTTIMASSYLSQAPDMAPEHVKTAQQIHRSGERMRRLVNDLIDYTRTHLGTILPLTLAPANLGAVALNAVDELRRSHPGRSIALDAGGDLDGVWDEGRMIQVLSNLVGNALQHGASNSPVTVTVAAVGDELAVLVHNRGKAIAPDELPHIFDPLVRFAEHSKQPAMPDSSLGIGLYIARVIVDAHGGALTVKSAPDTGTTFKVRLPRIAKSAASLH